MKSVEMYIFEFFFTDDNGGRHRGPGQIWVKCWESFCFFYIWSWVIATDL